jgi:hypothetical protein
MKFLKKFENRQDIWNIDREDIKEVFSDFIDDFEISVVFGKRLHQYQVTDVIITQDDLKSGFQPYVRVRLIPHLKSSPYELNGYINSDYFIERQSEIVTNLDYYDLVLVKVYVEVNSIIFLIYTK